MYKEEILFLGGVFPKHLENEVFKKSKGNMQNAANALQWNIIEGLEKNLGRPINLMNLMFIGSYPQKYQDIRIRKTFFSHAQGAKDVNIGFFNLTGIKQFLLKAAVEKELIVWAEQNKKSKKILIIYSAQSFFLEAAYNLKEKYKEISISLIVPDLPEYMSLENKESFFRSIIKKRNQKIIAKKIDSVDSFILLTKDMADYFKIKKPYEVIEGMVKSRKIDINEKQIFGKNNIKTVTYTGTLTKKYGIMDLVYAFMDIKNDNYNLVICGRGETEDEIKELAKKDLRIKYLGLLPYKKVQKLQENSTLLVNPRKNNESYTKYSFPSKLLEYLSSGTPVLAYNLDGIPKEYENYIWYLKNDSQIHLTKKIIECCEMSESSLRQKGLENIKFVNQEKNSIIQCKKILKLINIDSQYNSL
ncbi:MAG: glycosyltransferase [Firmicutes bacterium]|nr:glycosyltransferase [Bacillota bacterium]